MVSFNALVIKCVQIDFISMIKLQIKRVDISVHRRRRVRSFQVDLLRDDLRCVGLELEGKRVEGFVYRGKALQFLVLDVRYAVSALQV